MIVDKLYEVLTGWEFLSALALILILNAFILKQKWNSFKKGRAGMVIEPLKGPFHVVDWDLR